jgi:Tfp pilus assembly protein PilF
MQIVLRFLPQALIIVALVVLVIMIARKLPKTAKLEAELAMNKVPLRRPASKPARLQGITKLLRSTGRGIATGARAVVKVVGRGRLRSVLKLAERKRMPKVESVTKSSGAGVPTEKDKIILQLLREAEDYSRQANWPAAEKVYIKVVALQPKTLEAYLGLGNLYMKQKNWNDAASSYQVAIEGDRNNVTALGNLGLALANKGEWVAAVDALAKATRLDPGNAVRQATLAMAYMTIKDYKHAVRAYREAVKHDRENLNHKVELAKAAVLIGDKALAEENLTSVLARDPLNERAKAMLAEVRAKKDLE